MTALALGNAGLQGWRAKVADAVGPVVARRAPFSEDEVKDAIGAVFFVFSVVYVVTTLRSWLRRP